MNFPIIKTTDFLNLNENSQNHRFFIPSITPNYSHGIEPFMTREATKHKCLSFVPPIACFYRACEGVSRFLSFYFKLKRCGDGFL